MSKGTYLKKIKKETISKNIIGVMENKYSKSKEKAKHQKISQSKDRKEYLRKIKLRKIAVITTQILIIVIFIVLWEILANNGIIDSFIMSSPSRIVKTFFNLAQNNLGEHLLVTCTETIIGFLLGTGLGAVIAIILWWSKFISKVSEPFLVVLNSLPKIALRPSNNYMGRSWNASNYSNGISYIVNSNST